jgi:hypothetical protein
MAAKPKQANSRESDLMAAFLLLNAPCRRGNQFTTVYLRWS